MRRTILRMIATGSLSAFSTSALQGLPSQAVQRAGGAGVRARGGQLQPQVQPAPLLPLEQGKASGQAGGRPLPRGSLLDLSV